MTSRTLSYSERSYENLALRDERDALKTPRVPHVFQKQIDALRAENKALSALNEALHTELVEVIAENQELRTTYLERDWLSPGPVSCDEPPAASFLCVNYGGTI